MNHDILQKYMMKFSVESLKKFLGEDLVESLIEWNPGTGTVMTKKNLSSMILSIYGTSILRSKDFRRQLLKTMSEKDILSFRINLPSQFSNSTDLELIVDAVANISWKENQINSQLLRMLSYTESDVFEKKTVVESAIQNIESHDRFYELLDYQYIIRQKALHVLTSNAKLQRALIHMPTGTGKTKTAIHIICHHYNYNLKKKGLVIWIAHTSELLQQAYETFCSVWRNIGNGEVTTYRLWDNYELDVEDGPFSGFMVCGIQKLQALEKSKPDMFEQLIKDTRLIVYDEAHKASARETRHTIEQFMTLKNGIEDRRLLGLSATPGRTTEGSFDNELLASMFGNKIIGIDTKLMNAVNMSPQEAINTEAEKDIIAYFQKRGVLAKIRKEELTYEEDISDEELKKIKVTASNNGYDDFTQAALEQIGRNKSRNLRIIQRLRELNRDGIPTIVFACSVKHGQLLSAMLTLEGIENALIIGDMTWQERKESINRFKDKGDPLNIIINYQVLTTGFDATNIKCVFIARPTQSVVLYSQMIGRGLRGPQMGGNEECLLIDVKDNLKQYNENMAFSHFANYWNQ